MLFLTGRGQSRKGLPFFDHAKKVSGEEEPSRDFFILGKMK